MQSDDGAVSQLVLHANDTHSSAPSYRPMIYSAGGAAAADVDDDRMHGNQAYRADTRRPCRISTVANSTDRPTRRRSATAAAAAAAAAECRTFVPGTSGPRLNPNTNFVLSNLTEPQTPTRTSNPNT